MRQRVVITGIGGICGLGTDAAAIWEAMRAGRSAIGPIENVELHELKVRVGSQVKALPEHGIDRKQLVSMDRFSLLAVIAARGGHGAGGLRRARPTNGAWAPPSASACAAGSHRGELPALLLEGRNRAGIFTVPR